MREGGGGDPTQDEAPPYSIKSPGDQKSPPKGPDNVTVLENEATEIQIEDTFVFEINILENWLETCDARLISLRIIDEVIDEIYTVQDMKMQGAKLNNNHHHHHNHSPVMKPNQRPRSLNLDRQKYQRNL